MNSYIAILLGFGLLCFYFALRPAAGRGARLKLFLFGVLSLGAGGLFAQTNDVPGPLPASGGFDLTALLISLVAKYPKLSAVIGIMGLLRAVLKPIVEAVHKYVLSTPGTADDDFVQRIERGRFSKIFLFILDWGASVKIPQFTHAAKLLVVGAFAAALLFTGGCVTATRVGPDGQTNTVQRLDPVKTATAIRIATEAAIPIVLHKEPQTRAYFVQAQTVLTLVLNDAQLDPQPLRELIAQIDGSDEAWMAVNVALGLYQLYAGDVVSQQLDRNVYLRPVLGAFRDAIATALRIVPPPAAMNGEPARHFLYVKQKTPNALPMCSQPTARAASCTLAFSFQCFSVSAFQISPT